MKSVKTKRLLNASTVSSIDMSKENKGFSRNNSVHWDNVIESVSSNLSIPCCSAPRQIISKSATIKNKLERKNFVKNNSNKKTKILCDATTSTTGQVPRKKIKVQSQHIGTINKGDNSTVSSKDTILTCYTENTSNNKKYTVDTTYDMCFTTTSTSLPNFITSHQTLTDTTATSTSYPVIKKIKSECKLLTTQKNIDLVNTLDDSSDAPCCSSSLTPSVTESMSVLNFHNKMHSRNNNNANSNNNNENNTSDNSNVNNINNKIKSKFSKTSSPNKQISKMKTGEVSNLKKKRTLKTDPKLKRKKNRVKIANFSKNQI